MDFNFKVSAAPVASRVAGRMTEVVKVGEVAKTAKPVPVSSVTAEAKLALEGVARKVATPVANPLTPVEIGSPVTLVITPDSGVPSAGATKVLLLIVTALVLKTNSSTTPAKSGMVKVVAPIVWEVRAMVANCPLVSKKGEAAEVAREVAEATPKVGVTKVGLVLKTRLVDVVPVDPAAV